MSTVADRYGDEFELSVSAQADGQHLVIDVNPEDDETPVTYFLFDREAAEKFVATLNSKLSAVGFTEVAGIKRPHPDAVLASSVSYNEAVLRLAAAHDRTVEFSYSKGDGSFIERRRLQPESVREVKGHMTFTGFDPDRQDVRAYRLDRISGEVTI